MKDHWTLLITALFLLFGIGGSLVLFILDQNQVLPDSARMVFLLAYLSCLGLWVAIRVFAIRRSRHPDAAGNPAAKPNYVVEILTGSVTSSSITGIANYYQEKRGVRFTLFATWFLNGILFVGQGQHYINCCLSDDPFSWFYRGFRDDTQIILSNPPVYKYLPEGARYAAGDRRIPDSLHNLTASELKDLSIVRLPVEDSVDGYRFTHIIMDRSQYTGIGDAMGAALIRNFFLHKLGMGPCPIRGSLEFGEHSRIDRNSIILGGWISNNLSSKKIRDRFTYAKDRLGWFCERGFIYDAKDSTPAYPDPREVQRDPERRSSDYVLLTRTRLFKNDPRTLILVEGLNTQGTAAGADFITNEDCLRELMLKLKDRNKLQPPPYFQAIVKVDLDRAGGNIAAAGNFKPEAYVDLEMD